MDFPMNENNLDLDYSGAAGEWTVAEYWSRNDATRTIWTSGMSFMKIL